MATVPPPRPAGHSDASAPSRAAAAPSGVAAYLKVTVRPFNIHGRPLHTRDRALRNAYCGALIVREERMDAFGRPVRFARLVDVLDGLGATLLELYDVELLWLDARKMRLRGFEVFEGTQYAQGWEVEVL